MRAVLTVVDDGYQSAARVDRIINMTLTDDRHLFRRIMPLNRFTINQRIDPYMDRRR